MGAAELPGLKPARPIPPKDRASIIFIEKGNVDVLDGAFVVFDKNVCGHTLRSAFDWSHLCPSF
jgi:hypothetical protein